MFKKVEVRDKDEVEYEPKLTKIKLNGNISSDASPMKAQTSQSVEAKRASGPKF